MIATKKWIEERIEHLKEWVRGEIKQRIEWHEANKASEAASAKLETATAAVREAERAAGYDSRQWPDAVLKGTSSTSQLRCECLPCQKHRRSAGFLSKVIDRMAHQALYGRDPDPKDEEIMTPLCAVRRLERLEAEHGALLRKLGLSVMNVSAKPAGIELVPSTLDEGANVAAAQERAAKAKKRTPRKR